MSGFMFLRKLKQETLTTEVNAVVRYLELSKYIFRGQTEILTELGF